MVVNLVDPDTTMAADRAATPAPTTEENTKTNEEIAAPANEEVITLLRQAGLTKVPTIEEAKAILDARREEIRAAVLRQADERDWCYDGTRKVCANLRLRKPEDRSRFDVKVRMEVEMTLQVRGFTLESAMHRHARVYSSQGSQWLSERWLNRYLPDVSVSKVTVESMAGPDGDPIDYTTIVTKGETND